MSLLNQIYEKNEIAFAEHDRMICETILRELEAIYQIPFVGFNGQPNVMMVLSFFRLPGNEKFRNTVFDLMEKHSLNRRSFLFRLISEIYPPDFLEHLRMLPNCLTLIQEKDHYRIETSFGTLRLYRLTDMISLQNVRYVLQREDMHQKCHAVIEGVAPYFPNDFITTSKLPLLFGGKHYHSYMVCEDGSGVMDFSRNTFFEGTCFEDVFKPGVITQYKASELDERFKKLEQDYPELPNGFYKVLQLALKEEVDVYGKSIS